AAAVSGRYQRSDERALPADAAALSEGSAATKPSAPPAPGERARRLLARRVGPGAGQQWSLSPARAGAGRGRARRAGRPLVSRTGRMGAAVGDPLPAGA